MSDGKCPNCGDTIDTDGIAYKCRSRIQPFEQSHVCEIASKGYERGRSDAIRELTEWRTGEPPEGVENIIVEKKIDIYEVLWRGYHGQWQWYELAGGECFEIRSSHTLPDFAKKWRPIHNEY